MSFDSSDIGLLFTIKANSQQALDEFGKFKNKLGSDTAELQKNFKGFASELSNLTSEFTGDRLSGIASQITSFAGAVGAIPGPAGLAVGAVAGIGVAAAGLGTVLFEITSKAAEAGNKIFELSEKTGLSATTISSLKVAADKSGASIDELSRGITKFTVLMGEAAAGNDKAAATLKALGVTSTDLDTGFAQVVKRIAELKPGVEQVTAASAAFGVRLGAQLIPLINQFHGDLPALIAECERLGLTIGDKDAEASHKFESQMKTLDSQLASISRTVGFELLPVFEDLSTKFSDWLSQNKGEVSSWAKSVADSIQGLIVDIQKEGNDLGAIGDFFDVMFSGGNGQDLRNAWQKRYLEGTRQEIAKTNIGKPTGGVNDQADEYQLYQSGKMPGVAPSPEQIAAQAKALQDQKDAEEKAAKDREEIAKRDAAARVDILKNQLQQSDTLFKQSFDQIKATYEAGGTKDAFLKAYDDALTIRNKAVNDVLPKLTAAENQYATEAKKTGEELKLLADQQATRQKAEQQKGVDIVNEKNKILTDGEKKRNQESIDALKTRLDQEYQIKDAASKTVLARLQKDTAEGIVTEQAAFQTRKQTDLDLANLKLQNLEAVRAAMVKFGIDTAAIDTEIKVQREAVDTEKLNLAAEGNAIVKKGLEDEKQLNEQILRIRQQITEEERHIKDLDYGSQRNNLEQQLGNATGPKEHAAILQEIAALDAADARRQSADRDADIEAEKNAELEKVKDYANAQQLKLDIEKKADTEHEANAKELGSTIKGITDKLKIDTDPFAQLKKSWQELKEELKNSADIQASLASIGSLGVQVFQDMKGALEQAIEGWLLYGNSIGKALKQALAAELAHVAAVAAVHALEAAAWGFLYLATGQWVSAAHAFTSAALRGALAVTTGIAAKALAVKQTQTAATTGAFGAAGTAPGQNTNTSGEGKQFSSFGNDAQIVDTARGKPFGGTLPTQKHEITLTVKSNDSHIIGVLQQDVDRGGRTRDLIINVASAG